MHATLWSRLGLIAAFCIALTAPFSTVVAQGLPEGVTVGYSIEVAGRDRSYRVHTPPSSPPSHGFPVLVVLHGGGGNARQVERSSGFSELADTQGFIAVYPDGSGRRDLLLTWNAHNCCAYANEHNIDDGSFISALIDQVVEEHGADPTRGYVTGHSNGAMMTFRLACELAGKVAAAAPYAGSLNTDTCAPLSPVPILIMNGEDDSMVPVAGGSTLNIGASSEADRVDRPTAFAVDTWVKANGCAGPPVIDDSPATLVRSWTSCANGSAVEQLLIHDWEHAWPSVDDGAPIDAASIIWAFVSQFSKPQA